MALRTSDVDRVITLVHGTCGISAAEAVGSSWTIHPPDTDLNRALSWALTRLPRPVLVVAADLPALSPGTVDRLLERRADVVIGSTQDGGTGLLRLSTDHPLELAYGKQSARRHALAAEVAGLSVEVCSRRHEFYDVDTFADVLSTASRWPWVGRATREALSSISGMTNAAHTPREA